MDDMAKQLADLAANFAKIGRNATTAMERGLVRAGNIVADTAKLMAPVDTGLLRRSIRYRLTAEKNPSVVEVGTNVEYAQFQEFGTSMMQPQPFMQPALDQNRANIVRVCKEEIERTVT